MFNKSIERDFGKGFLFSMETLNVTEEDLEKYQSGTPLDADKFKDCNVRFFTDGYYPRVVRLSKDIPTFDSGDREYDSWHDLYLVQEQSGNIHAVDVYKRQSRKRPVWYRNWIWSTVRKYCSSCGRRFHRIHSRSW